MDLDLTELRYFHNVATTRSFAEGARRSQISGPAISKAIKKLEETVGTRLLERTSRRVSVTASGELVLEYCRRLFATMDELEGALDSDGRQLRGELRIGSTEAFNAYALPQAIARVCEQHPRLLPRVYRASARQIERMLLTGQLDVGLCVSTPEHSPRVDSRRLAQSPVSIVCGRRHPLFAAGELPAPEELERHPFIALHDVHDDGRPTVAIPRALGRARVGATTDTLPMAVQLVVDGAYLGCFPEVAIRCQLNHQELRRLRAPESTATATAALPGVELRALTVGSRASVELLIATLEVTVAEALTLECA